MYDCCRRRVPSRLLEGWQALYQPLSPMRTCIFPSPAGKKISSCAPTHVSVIVEDRGREWQRHRRCATRNCRSRRPPGSETMPGLCWQTLRLVGARQTRNAAVKSSDPRLLPHLVEQLSDARRQRADISPVDDRRVTCAMKRRSFQRRDTSMTFKTVPAALTHPPAT